MKDRIFIDTNIWVYAAQDNSAEVEKRKKSLQILQMDIDFHVSTHVLNEFYNVMLKHKFKDSQIIIFINAMIANSNVEVQNIATLRQAWIIKEKYQFSLWDSLIIASALQNNCNILYSEDMQHNQLIEDRLKIINPF